jgi:hypothetical protein
MADAQCVIRSSQSSAWPSTYDVSAYVRFVRSSHSHATFLHLHEERLMFRCFYRAPRVQVQSKRKADPSASAKPISRHRAQSRIDSP